MTPDNVGVWEDIATSRRVSSLSHKMFLTALAIGGAAALLYLAVPKFDLQVSQRLYVSHNRFLGSGSPTLNTIRHGFYDLLAVVGGLSVVGSIITLARKKRWLSVSARGWLYLAVCLLVGPLTVTNLGFKDHWGRARPINVSEFGVEKSYSPPLELSYQCDYNCSFFSGDASSNFILCFAAAFLFPGAARTWIATGLVLGTFVGFLRMVEGAHFLSDILFAGVAMALVASGVEMLFNVLAGADSRPFASK